jgi:hypothetical protein
LSRAAQDFFLRSVQSAVAVGAMRPEFPFKE